MILFRAFLLLLANSVFAARVDEAPYCGTTLTEAQIQSAEKDFTSKRLTPPSTSRFTTSPKNINVHFHVIYNETTGNVPDSQIEDQLTVLNTDFAGIGFEFTLVNTERILNASWYGEIYAASPLQDDMKRALRVGGPADLNVYVVETASEALLGYAAFPVNATGDTLYHDGIVISTGTLPGGSRSDGYNLGKTATHEVGHWVGLYHTFEGRCSGAGDLVEDTPAERGSPECLTERDTCPDLPGLDPRFNFMSYGFDDCKKEFTPGQAARAAEQMYTYRGI